MLLFATELAAGPLLRTWATARFFPDELTYTPPPQALIGETMLDDIPGYFAKRRALNWQARVQQLSARAERLRKAKQTLGWAHHRQAPMRMTEHEKRLAIARKVVDGYLKRLRGRGK